MSNTWRGYGKQLFNLTTASPPGDDILTINLTHPPYDYGHTIERLLLSYYLISAPVLDADVPQPWIGWPLAAAAWFYPNPDFPNEPNTTSVEDAMAGDALFSDLLRFKPVRWTDGTDHGWIFIADSGGVQSVKGNRTIRDTGIDTLNFGIGGIGGDADLPLFEPGFYGHLWMKFVTQHP